MTCTGQIAVKFAMDIYAPQRTITYNYGDALTSPLAQALCQNFHVHTVVWVNLNVT